jgi:plastocyanin
VWGNTGRMEHSVTALDGSFDSGLLKPGETWTRTFDTPAFIDYRCTPHPWMRGVLRVAALTGPPPAPPAARTAAGASVAPAPPRSPVRQGSGPATHNVDIVEPSLPDTMSWTFNPKIVEARAGDTVVWRNAGTIEHSVTAGIFDAGLLAAGTTFTKTFDSAGLYTYQCTPHPWMKGIVRVASTEGGAVPEIPASLETGSAGPGPQAASALPPSPLHLLARAKNHGNAAVKLGWALLLGALAVGFSWAWSTPMPTGTEQLRH